MKPKTRIYHEGFTLIELSIVLVIIGLIIGSILVGADLIEASKTRKQFSDLEKIDSAVMAFKLKYNAIPGDMLISQATPFALPYDASGYPGAFQFHNGNGKLSDYNFAAGYCLAGLHNGVCVGITQAYYGEAHYFMVQLAAAQLIPWNIALNPDDLTTSAIPMVIGKGYIMPTSSTWGKNGYFLGMGTTITTSHFINANALAGSLFTMQSLLIDKKFDDGSPEKGKIRAVHPDVTGSSWGFYEDWGPEFANTRNCVTGASGSRTYNTATTTADCQLWVQGSW